MAPRTNLVLVAAVLTASCYPGRAWWDRLQAADFPARVAAIELGDGRKLTKALPLQHGAWTVSFAANPAAHAYGGGAYRVSRVTVSGLMCRNKVAGDMPCTLSMARPPGGPVLYADHVPPPCVLFIGRQRPIPIDCPASVKLER